MKNSPKHANQGDSVSINDSDISFVIVSNEKDEPGVCVTITDLERGVSMSHVFTDKAVLAEFCTDLSESLKVFR